MPYLMDSGYANLQSKVGLIYGSLSVVSIAFVYFCVPECHGKSFEEIDQMFREKVSLRKFGNHELSESVSEERFKHVPSKVDSV